MISAMEHTNDVVERETVLITLGGRLDGTSPVQLRIPKQSPMPDILRYNKRLFVRRSDTKYDTARVWPILDQLDDTTGLNMWSEVADLVKGLQAAKKKKPAKPGPTQQPAKKPAKKKKKPVKRASAEVRELEIA